MAALYGPPPKVIWLRVGNRPTAAIEETLRRNHALICDFARAEEAACLELYQAAPGGIGQSRLAAFDGSSRGR